MSSHRNRRPRGPLPGPWTLAAAGALWLASSSLAPPASATDLCPGATHAGPDYSGQNLQGRNFSNQNLRGADFSNAQLQGAVFVAADLTGADFTGANLGIASSNDRAATFSRANLTNACFYGALTLRTDFQFANLACTVFAGNDLRTAIFGPAIQAAAATGSCRTSFVDSALNCEFIAQWKDLELKRASVQECYTQLAGADFSNARMEGIIFSGLDLTGARFDRAVLRGAYFLRAKLNNATFSGADLRLAQLSLADATGARFDQQAQLQGARLTGVKLQGADLTSAVLQGANGLPSADLSLAFMPDTILTDAKLTGVSFSHASFYGALARADNATMELIDFSNANLSGLTLTQGRLKGAKLDAANLVNAKLIGVDLTATGQGIAASLVQSNLQGVDFTDARLGGANLSNAAVALDQGVPLFKAPSSLAGSLDQRELSAEVAAAFSDSGYVLAACQNPEVIVDQTGRSWQVWLNAAVGPASGPRFAKFALETKSGQIAVSGLLPTAAPTFLFNAPATFAATLDKRQLASALLAAFTTAGYRLPPCVNPAVSLVTAGSSWRLRETLTTVTVASLGYTGYGLALEGGEIQAYGTEVTIIRPDAQGSLGLTPVAINKTNLSPSSLDSSSICPNQQTYGANVAGGVSWKDMMTAAKPPRPPVCIPSLLTWCNVP